MPYLVKFVSEKKFKPSALNCFNFGIKLGTFHHYRSIEDIKFRDPSEGQRGREVVIKRPCEKLVELSEQPESYINLDPSHVGEDGNFIPRTALLIHDHLADFNAWVFCCSLVNDLDEIPAIQKRFGAVDYFFIIKPEAFSSKLLSALGADLKKTPINQNGDMRINGYDFKTPLLLDGYHSLVQYDNDTQWMETVEAETLTDFISSEARNLDKNIWFRKHEKFRAEKEFRWVFYPSLGRSNQRETYYSVKDDFRILNADICGCFSSSPKEAEFEQKRPRLDPLIRKL